MKTRIAILCFILCVPAVSAAGCGYSDVQIRSADLLLGSADKIIDGFVIDGCIKKSGAPKTAEEAVAKLTKYLPAQYLQRIKLLDNGFNPYKLPLVEPSSGSFVDLYRTLENLWGFSENYTFENSFSPLQKEAKSRHLYVTNNYFFEALFYGVWQELNGLGVNLNHFEVNGVLLEQDFLVDVGLLKLSCDNASIPKNRVSTVRTSTNYLRRLAWSACGEKPAHYGYLFEMGWFLLDEQLVSQLQD